jgi:hypothetical protein
MTGRIRTSIWRVVRASLIVVAVIAVGCFLWVRSVANEQWDRMTARIEELEAIRKADSPTRPVLRGSPEPGNAWESYGQAIANAPMLSRNPTFTRYFEDLRVQMKHPTATLPQMEVWAAPGDAALEQLRVGTRRTELRPTIVWERRFSPLVLELDHAWWGVWVLSHAGVVNAHLLIERGQSDKAAELLMDLCQFGRDALQGTDVDGCRIGVDVLFLVSNELRKLLREKQLSIDALQRLDHELELLDRHWPSGKETLFNHLLAIGLGGRQEVDQGSLMYQGRAPRSFRSWRWGYSARFRAASTFLRAEQVIRLMIQEAGGGALAYGSGAAIHEWADPVLADAFRYPTSADPGIGERASFRVLRTGIHFLITGNVLDLPDPFGDRLKTVVEGTKLRIWSIGADRVDQGGVEEGWTYNRDIVLEVER